MTQWKEHMTTCSCVRGKTTPQPQLCPSCAARPPCELQQHWTAAHPDLCFSRTLCPMVFARLQEGKATCGRSTGRVAGRWNCSGCLAPELSGLRRGGEVLWGAWAAVRCKECDYTGVGLQVSAGGLAGENLSQESPELPPPWGRVGEHQLSTYSVGSTNRSRNIIFLIPKIKEEKTWLEITASNF